MATPLDILHQVFGYTNFRGKQEDIIDHVIDGGNSLVLMPTGGGKSLCYQIPALIQEGTAIVVSPLLALMRDQEEALKQAGVQAAQLSSANTPKEAILIKKRLLNGEIKILYVAPERFVMPSFQDMLQQISVSLFAIDEAHCVNQWGHDFRPEYLHIGTLIRQHPAPRIALTATADPYTQDEIIARLSLEDAKIFKSSFDRPNITYIVGEKKDPNTQLLDFLKDFQKQSGIVYCLSRKKVEDTAVFLQQNGFDALPYHAGISLDQKNKNQDRFLREDNVIMVATIAFGMGIDKPDVRFVVHLDLPASLESYYQETGRAGRDGCDATAYMIYGMQDIVQRQQMIENGDGSERHKRALWKRLQSLLAYTESPECRRAVVLRHFGERDTPTKCNRCDRCLQPVETFDGTTDVLKLLSAVVRTGQRFGGRYLIQILRGQNTSRIQQFQHHLLPTYGIGKDKSEIYWLHVLRQCIASGFLEAPTELHGGLILTEEGIRVLKRERVVSLVEPTIYKKKITASPKIEENAPLIHAIKTWRTKTAKEQGVPPYVVFNDKTLADLIQQKPKNHHLLQQIHGFGINRVERYGDELLILIHTYA